MAGTDLDDLDGTPLEAPKDAGQTAYEGLLDVLMTGLVIAVPFVVSVYVLELTLDFITSAFQPFVGVLELLGVIQFFERAAISQFLLDLQVFDMPVYGMIIGILEEIIALFVLLAVVFIIGSVGKSHYGEQVVDGMDEVISAIPGFGTVYESFRQMGDVVHEGGTESFREVKLIEWREGVHVLGFVTNSPPPSIDNVTGESEIVTVFVPFAPNPVTGGFLTYIERSKLEDVDMTLDEGIRSVISSGMAVETEDRSGSPMPADD
jgi:uncharacterized membrane protein